MDGARGPSAPQILGTLTQCLLAHGAHAGPPNDRAAAGQAAEAPGAIRAVDPAVAKVVYRLYELTVGARQRCPATAAQDSPNVSATLDRFESAYPGVRPLLVASPYYAPSARQYAERVSSRAARDTPQSVAAECHAYALLLRSMVDDPAGRDAERTYEATLAASNPAPARPAHDP